MTKAANQFDNGPFKNLGSAASNVCQNHQKLFIHRSFVYRVILARKCHWMGFEYSKCWKLHSFLMCSAFALHNVNNKFVVSILLSSKNLFCPSALSTFYYRSNWRFTTRFSFHGHRPVSINSLLLQSQMYLLGNLISELIKAYHDL